MAKIVNYIMQGYVSDTSGIRKIIQVVRGNEVEFFLTSSDGNIESAFLIKNNSSEYCYKDKKAREIYKIYSEYLKGCSAKNGVPTMYVIGAGIKHSYKRKGADISVMMCADSVVGFESRTDSLVISLSYEGSIDDIMKKKGVNLSSSLIGNAYIELTGATKKKETNKQNSSSGMFANNDSWALDEDDIPIRTLEEVSLEKDITWLNNKKYYIINDSATAEKIFKFIENYDKTVSYDVETSGLRINMFGEIGSERGDELIKWNEEHPNEKIKADYLVGFSFTVDEGIGYYFPCKHRKFKNLYEDNDELTIQIRERIKSEYTIGKYRDRNDNMAKYIMSHSIHEFSCDVVLMERCRYIFETRNMMAFNSSFEWKTTWLYNIDLNVKDDPMLMHQLMYKSKRVRTNRGEPSNLKYLSRAELGIDQLDLSDFFTTYKEEDDGRVRYKYTSGKKSKSKRDLNIDFSYMTYKEAKAYAPADVDLALSLFYKYKRDLVENHPELEYLYQCEVLLACAVGYAEYYGFKISPDKIEGARKKTEIQMSLFEHTIRNMNNLSSPKENYIIEQIHCALVAEEIRAADDAKKFGVEYSDKIPSVMDILNDYDKYADRLGTDELEKAVSLSEQFIKEVKEQGNLNMAAPGQVAELLYSKYGWNLTEDGKKSVGKKVLKQYADLKDNNDNLLYPEVKLYRKWKDLDTLLGKFFSKMQDFMYPGGFVFPNFNQMAAATGRFNSKQPNSQQLPKNVTKITVPRDGHVYVDADFSQIEYRVLVGLAKEEGLINDFKDPDNNYHTLMSSKMFEVDYAAVTDEMRKQGKILDFAIPFGMGFKSIAIMLHGRTDTESVEDAKAKYDMYFSAQPNVKEFFVLVKESAQINEYTLTHFKRPRWYSFVDKDGNYSRKHVSMALRQAGNAVIQGTARDIFGIAVVRNFTNLRNKCLLGKVLMVNYIHDEILFEINCNECSVAEALGDILEAMQMQIKGFPPIYVGAGVGMNWKDAKSSMAEIHPVLGQWIQDNRYEIKTSTVPEEVNKQFEEMNTAFRKYKITKYIKNEQLRKNKGENISTIDPAISGLLALQFDYGIEKRMKIEAKDLGLDKDGIDEYMKDLTLRRIKEYVLQNAEMFIGEENITEHEVRCPEDLGITWFNGVTQSNVHTEEDDDNSYDDEDDDENNNELNEYEFAMIDESDIIYGLSVIDIIEQFGTIVSTSKRICGIDIRKMGKNRIESLADILLAHRCSEDDYGAMQVVLMNGHKMLLKPGMWVNGISGNDIETIKKICESNGKYGNSSAITV